MEMIWATVKMILALGIGLTLLFLLIRFTKRWDLARRSSPRKWGIRVLTSKPIAPQKYISLVEIGGEVLALGVSEQQVTFLTKIENQEMVKESLDNPGRQAGGLFLGFRFGRSAIRESKQSPLRILHEK